jgi:hypothetical protein
MKKLASFIFSPSQEITLVDLYHLPTACMLVTIGCNVMESKPNVARQEILYTEIDDLI